MAILAAAPALAQGNDPDDIFPDAVRCAGLWLGDYAAQAITGTDPFEDARQSRDMGLIFRDVALEARPGAIDQADYLITGWTGYFLRLASDGGGVARFPPATDGTRAQWAGEEFLRHQRFCQGFGLSLDDKWGFH